MRQTKMLPPAVRWLCLLLLTVPGVIGQLTVGDPNSFLLEDLDGEVTTQSSDSAVGEVPAAVPATELPPDDTTLLDLDVVTLGEEPLTPETISALEEEEIMSVASDTDFGSKIASDAVLERPTTASTVPELTRRILVSGTLPATPVVPEPTVSISRPSSLVRLLSDPGWLPNWPSHLLPSDSVTRKPTIRFPTAPPSNDLGPTPIPAEVVPDATPVPSIIPSLTVSKVPVTQYFFDLTSAAPKPAPGPLFDPEDLGISESDAVESQDDLNRPAIDLASSIPELQSSAFIPTANPVYVTPTLVNPQTLAVTVSPESIAETLVATPTLTLTPTKIPPSIETEVVDNDLANENYNNVTTLVSEIPKDLDLETTGPHPPQNLPDYPEDESDYTTTQDVIDSSSPLPPTAPIAVLSEEPSGIGVAQPDPSASTTPLMSESELETSLSTDSVGSIKPTSVRTLQAVNTSRTPLWMLLSQSMPSKTVNIEAMHTSLTSPVVSIPETNSLTTTVPTVASTDILSDVDGEVSPNTDLVSSLLISSKFSSSNPELTTVSIDSLDTRTSLENVAFSIVPIEDAIPSIVLVEEAISSLVPSTSLFSAEIQPTESVSDHPVPIFPSSDNTKFTSPEQTTDPEATAATSSLYDLSSVDLVKTSEFVVPTTPIPTKATENPELISVTPPHTEQISSSEILREPSVSVPLNTTIEYHESSEEPLIITVPEEESMQQDSLSTANDGLPVVVSIKTNSDTWTPVVEFTEKSIDSTLPTPLSSLTTNFSSVTQTAPELTGGFIPVISETTKSSPVLHSELMLDTANISFTTATTAIVASTTALAENLGTQFESSPSLTDTFNVQESDRISASEHLHTVEDPEFSVTKDRIMSSILLLSTTTFPVAKSEPTSVSLTPSFNVSISSSDSPFSVNILESEKKTTNLEPSMIVIERLPSSTTFPVTEIVPSATPSIPLFSVSSTVDVTTSPVSSVVSIIPSSTTSPYLPLDPISPIFQPDPTTLSSIPTSDLPSLVTPTVTEETTEVATQISYPQVPPVEEEGDASKDATTTTKNAEAVVPEEPFFPATTPLPPTVPSTTPSTTTTTTTEKDMTTKMAAPPTPVTSPVPTTPESSISVTSNYPTESMPSLTTSVTLPNGTVVENALPYVRALVAYNEKEFCQHKDNFRMMLAEWISQHLQEETLVSPSEIQFFNMPQCGLSKPGSDEHVNHFSENLGNSGIGFEGKQNESLENEEVTNVYFYITKFGHINPNLTEKFPLFPMQLEITEELTYLRAKVSQLELVRPDGSTHSAPEFEEASIGTSGIVIIVIVTIVVLTIITALICFMVVKKRGTANNYYGRRCTPVSMDAYSMDSVSVYHSFRRKSKRRASGRSVKSYLNQAFDDPNGPTRPLNFAKLTHFISDIDGVHEEFATIPVNMPKYDELPSGVEDKNRYANVIPVPETRVLLKGLKDSRNSEYINANYVRGPRNESKYYIATQAPLDDTVADFWRMIWEHETRVVVMLTDFVEKGIDKCADYLPPSETLDCHRLYGDFQVTLKSRDMREKFVVSNVQLKNLENNLMREVAHMWFTGWPASGVPNEETAFISYILDIRRTRKKLRAKGPILVHCSPGTGRSGTYLACDLVMRQFEDQRSVDIPRTVYSIRRDRAGAVQTKEQYAFIYRVINLYASKLTTGNLDSL